MYKTSGFKIDRSKASNRDFGKTPSKEQMKDLPQTPTNIGL